MYFRAYYAIRPLNTSSGLPTNALFGFLSMTVKLFKDLKPDYLAFCFDRPEPSFRKEIYSEYKANRTEMPDDLKPQVPYIRKLTDAMGIAAIEKPGFEADDIIGTLADRARKKGIDVVIVSGDKDFAQLIDSHVSMYDTLKDVNYDPKKVEEKWGVKPHQFIDYLALTGDSSDNIPGVAGIGPKGAQKLLAEYESLAGIYEQIEKIKNLNIQNKLKEGKEDAFLSQKLVTIEQNVKLDIGLEELKFHKVDREKLAPLLEELEFHSFLKNLVGNGNNGIDKKLDTKDSVQVGVASPQVITETQEKKIDVGDLEKHFKEGDEVWAIDTPQGLYLAQGKKVLGIQGDALDVGRVLQNKNIQWMGYDIKKFWSTIKIKSPQAKMDLMLAEYLVKGGKTDGFEALYIKHLGGAFPELAGANDYYLGLQKIHQALMLELEEKRLRPVLTTIDLPLIPILYKMEQIGISLDRDELRAQGETLHKDMVAIEKEIIAEVGVSFNLASPKQLADVLFNKLKIPPLKKNKTGFSTDSDVLEKLSADYPVCKKIIEHREIAKLKSTYVDALPLLVNEETGRLHTHFNQVGTATGRLSSHDPNLQNIPIRSERGNRIRRAFVADSDCEFISADYSQIELRILAHITGDEGLCKAFAQDQDIHSATASEVFNVGLSEVTSDMRRMAKAVNFGIAYGQGAFGLAEALGIGRKESAEIIEKYFTKFKRVKDYMNDTVEEAKKKGYVESIFGRRRYISELKSDNQAIRKFGERAAINAPIQGSSSDLVKMAMIQADADVKTDLLLQVHDELLFECKKSDSESETKIIRETMEKVVSLKVPMKVNISSGKNWEEAH